MAEEWKKIAGIPYKVSNFGQVIGPKGKILQARKTPTGYCRINICYNGKQVDAYIHRLVIMAFVRPLATGEEVNHIDCNKSNNCLTNLEIVTHQENHLKAAMCWATNPIRKVTENVVLMIRHLLKNTTFKQVEIAKIFNISRSTVTDINIGRSWRYV